MGGRACDEGEDCGGREEEMALTAYGTEKREALKCSEIATKGAEQLECRMFLQKEVTGRLARQKKINMQQRQAGAERTRGCGKKICTSDTKHTRSVDGTRDPPGTANTFSVPRYMGNSIQI